VERNLYGEPQFGADALAIRSALRFRPEHVRRELDAGRGTSDTVASWLQRWARERPDVIAVASPGHMPLTYVAMLDRAERLAAALATLGVRRGDVVTVQLPSTVEFVIIYYAVARLGGILSTLHMPYGAARPSQFCGTLERVSYFAARTATNPIRPLCSRRWREAYPICGTSSPSGRRAQACSRSRR
jgi:non-ribosomal peptide synthetase component E (peptide arylation enzyme)